MSVDPRFAELQQALVDHYDLEELRTLCVHLGTNFDDLRGEGRLGKARELVLWLQRCGRLDELESTIQGARRTRQKGGRAQALNNPYYHRGPIRKRGYFCDREEEVRQVLWSISNEQCVSLVGSRRIGKTSLLFRLQALDQDQLRGESEGCVCVYIDGQAHQETSRSEFHSEILNKVCAALNQQDRRILPAESSRENVDLAYLRGAIGSFIHRGITVVLLIDEFDVLCENRNFDLAFFNGLRSLATLGVVYVTASKRTLFQLNREKEVLGSPFFNYFETMELGLFSEESALGLIREPSAERGIRFDEQTTAEILRLAGRHPFFLQRVCHIAFEMCRVKEGVLDQQDLEQVRRKSKRALQDQMTSYWEDLGPEEQQVLLGVAAGEALQQDSEVMLENLERQCLLVRSNGDYEVFSALFKDYVRAQSRPTLVRHEKWQDRFRDWEKLGEGEISVVYKAYQPELDRYVAIKELKPQADILNQHAERFRCEARSIARLDHPNILPVHDFHQEADRAYIVMKYASHGSLADRMKESQGPFDLAEAIDIVIYVGRALEYAHRRGVVHRDVKPANIFMGEDNWPLLGDFGLALTRGEAPAKETGLTGSSDYVSPEQAMDARDADHRSDIYSLGVVLYHLLVGEVPYVDEAHPGDRLMKRITQGVPAPRLRNSQIPVNMERIVLKATATSPQDRYQTAEDMVEDLQAILEGDGELRDSGPSGTLPPIAPSSRALDEYDVFISYSDEDEEWVKGTLLPRLEEAGLRACIGDRDFEPGVAILVNTENAVESSRKTVIVLTPAWVQSEWAIFESLLARTADPAGRQARMIPLLLSKCQVPRWIDFLARLDFTGDEDHTVQLQRLIKALKKGPVEALPGSEAGAG